LVEICKAWKKLIYEGSNPVGPPGIVTSQGAILPGLATAYTLLDSITYLSSEQGVSVKIRPILFLIISANLANYGFG